MNLRLPRPLWFALATAVLVVGAVGLRVGVPAYRQREAIRAIERLGGEVETAEGGPRWLRERVGGEWMRGFDEVVGVDLRHAQVTDAGLVHLTGLANLKKLYLRGTQITDAGLVHLKGHKSLQWVSVYSTPVTDAGLTHLMDCKNLTAIDTRGSRVTMKGVEELSKALPKCQILHDGGTIEPKK